MFPDSTEGWYSNYLCPMYRLLCHASMSPRAAFPPAHYFVFHCLQTIKVVLRHAFCSSPRITFGDVWICDHLLIAQEVVGILFLQEFVVIPKVPLVATRSRSPSAGRHICFAIFCRPRWRLLKHIRTCTRCPRLFDMRLRVCKGLFW
jgi:hypothetical protein